MARRHGAATPRAFGEGLAMLRGENNGLFEIFIFFEYSKIMIWIRIELSVSRMNTAFNDYFLSVIFKY